MAVSDAAMLAPEEVYAGKGDIKDETELTQAERKKRRAKKKRIHKGIYSFFVQNCPCSSNAPFCFCSEIYLLFGVNLITAEATKRMAKKGRETSLNRSEGTLCHFCIDLYCGGIRITR